MLTCILLVPVPRRTPKGVLLLFEPLCMLVLAATTPLDLPPDEPALLTLSAYLHRQNKDGKFHSSTAYDWNLARNQWLHVEVPPVDWDKYPVRILPSGFIILNEIDSKNIIGYIDNGVAFLSPKGRENKIPFSYRKFGTERGNIEHKETRVVKYPDRIANARLKSEQAADNLKRYPYVLQHIKLGGQPFEIRAEVEKITPGKGDALTVLNSDNLVVAQASDEWGATLVHVVQEYRGLGIGPVLTQLWYKYNPHYRSGGFSNAGRNQAAKVWAARVRTFLDNGWYSEMVKTGKMSKEDVKAIIADLKARPVSTPKEQPKQEAPSICIFSDDTLFVVFDRAYIKEQDKKHILGYGFLRETEELGIFFYRIEWDDGHEKLVNTVAMQMAYDIGESVYVGDTHADIMDLSQVPNVVVENKRASMTKPAFDLKHATALTKKILRKEDPMGEVKSSLIEDAEAKWN